MLQSITEYWSQITILLLAIGYLFKLYLNYLSRKSEINHSLFQKMMMDAVADFLRVYSLSEELWRDLPILQISKGKYTPKELDKMIFAPLNNIKSKTIQLRIFLNDKDMKPFEKIESNLFKINSKVSEIYHNFQMNIEVADVSWEYGETMESLNVENRILIGEIQKIIQRKFK